MEKAFRKTGIDIIGDASWGTHLCQFYETREDLVDILVPYFKAGLENNEFCMWITSEPLKVEDAKASLKKVVKNLDHFIKKGQIEILDYSEWYTKSGKFEANNVLQGWVEKENQALKRGYDGLRLSGNTFWLEKKDFRNFTDYEKEVNNLIGKYRMIAICTYSLGKCRASEVIDVVSNHQFALIRREGKWVIIESSERKQAEAALRISHRFLEIANRHTGMTSLLNEFVIEVQKFTQCAAVGIRILDEEGNIPYQAYKGFSQRFYESESPLSIKSDQCMCINVVKGVTDPKVPFYTEGGSFYMNGTTRFLATVSEEEKGQTRNVCNQVGYESVALVPIRLGDRILGLIHVADPQENMVRLEKVEILERVATQLGAAIQRLKTEEALRESKENFKTLAENAIDGILIAMDEGATVYANKRTAEIMGYSVAELLKTSIKDLAHPDEFEKIMERYRERLEAKSVPSQYETIVVRKDGKNVPIELAATKTVWQGQPADLVFLRDITDRKRAEEALRESEEKYRTLFEESRDSIYITSKKGEILDVNQSFLDLFGYTREEILKLDVQKTYINLADRESFQKEIEQKGYVKDFEVKLCKKGGTEMVCLLTSTVKQAPDKSILGYQGIIRDITERKKAEEALRESKEFVENLIASIQDGLSVLDSHGVHIDVNPAFCQMAGFSREELIGVGLPHPYWPPEAYEEIEKAFQKTLRGEFSNVELTFMRKNGERFPVIVSPSSVQDKQGNVVSYFATVKDITERKRAEEALRRSEEEARRLARENEVMAEIGRIISSTLDINDVYERFAEEVHKLISFDRIAINIINLEDQTFTVAYVTGVEITDRRQGDIISLTGTVPEKVLLARSGSIIQIADNNKTTSRSPAYLPSFRAGLRSMIAIPLISKDQVIGILHLQSIKPNAYTEKELRIAERVGQQIAGAVANAQLFAEHKRAEAERGQLLVDLEAKNRELESFVYTVSHDLKAPLVSLSGFSSVLQKDYESQLGEEGKHYLERIQANVAHMEVLIKSLLELSRIGQVVGSIEEIDVAALLREVRVALAVRLKEAGAEFVVQEPLPTVHADRGRYHQVFINLIDNAVKFRSAERALRIEVGCRQESGFNRFHVADNGIGIDPQYHEQIFTPFRKLHPEIEGAGIGLALVKKIVEDHGARVWVESEAGKGSTFYFTIPKADDRV